MHHFFFPTLLYIHLSIQKYPLLPSFFSKLSFSVFFWYFCWHLNGSGGLNLMCAHSSVLMVFKGAAVLSRGVKGAWDLRRRLISHSVNGIVRLWPLRYVSLKSIGIEMCKWDSNTNQKEWEFQLMLWQDCLSVHYISRVPMVRY